MNTKENIFPCVGEALGISGKLWESQHGNGKLVVNTLIINEIPYRSTGGRAICLFLSAMHPVASEAEAFFLCTFLRGALPEAL